MSKLIPLSDQILAVIPDTFIGGLEQHMTDTPESWRVMMQRSSEALDVHPDDLQRAASVCAAHRTAIPIFARPVTDHATYVGRTPLYGVLALPHQYRYVVDQIRACATRVWHARRTSAVIGEAWEYAKLNGDPATAQRFEFGLMQSRVLTGMEKGDAEAAEIGAKLDAFFGQERIAAIGFARMDAVDGSESLCSIGLVGVGHAMNNESSARVMFSVSDGGFPEQAAKLIEAIKADESERGVCHIEAIGAALVSSWMSVDLNRRAGEVFKSRGVHFAVGTRAELVEWLTYAIEANMDDKAAEAMMTARARQTRPLATKEEVDRVLTIDELNGRGLNGYEVHFLGDLDIAAFGTPEHGREAMRHWAGELAALCVATWVTHTRVDPISVRGAALIQGLVAGACASMAFMDGHEKEARALGETFLAKLDEGEKSIDSDAQKIRGEIDSGGGLHERICSFLARAATATGSDFFLPLARSFSDSKAVLPIPCMSSIEVLNGMHVDGMRLRGEFSDDPIRSERNPIALAVLGENPLRPERVEFVIIDRFEFTDKSDENTDETMAVISTSATQSPSEASALTVGTYLSLYAGMSGAVNTPRLLVIQRGVAQDVVRSHDGDDRSLAQRLISAACGVDEIACDAIEHMKAPPHMVGKPSSGFILADCEGQDADGSPINMKNGELVAFRGECEKVLSTLHARQKSTLGRSVEYLERNGWASPMLRAAADQRQIRVERGQSDEYVLSDNTDSGALLLLGDSGPHGEDSQKILVGIAAFINDKNIVNLQRQFNTKKEERY